MTESGVGAPVGLAVRARTARGGVRRRLGADRARPAPGSGTVVVAALGHTGGQGSSAFGRAPLWAPSGVAEVNAREMPKVMEERRDRGGRPRLRRGAASLAVDAGLDGVEVNAGQHSLVRQFLSGLTNHRGDAWGADRLRFAREVLAAVRAAASATASSGCGSASTSWRRGPGSRPSRRSRSRQELAPLVDYLVLVRGSIYSVAATRPDGHEQPGFNLAATAADPRPRSAARVAVFAQGSIVDPAMAAAAIADGTADGVEMTRAQIADGELVRKLPRRAPGRESARASSATRRARCRTGGTRSSPASATRGAGTRPRSPPSEDDPVPRRATSASSAAARPGSRPPGWRRPAGTG